MEKIKEFLKISSGSGYGSGYGDGSGYGYGDGSGYGSGDGYGEGIKSFGGFAVRVIDGIETILTKIHGNVSKAYILHSDFALEPCYVVKGEGRFAHGKTIAEASESLQKKILESMDTEEAIEKFVEKFRPDELYTCAEFYEWHHYLTGSCEMGRKAFMKDRGISMDDTITVSEFIALCEGSYGGEIIKKLKEKY